MVSPRPVMGQIDARPYSKPYAVPQSTANTAHNPYIGRPASQGSHYRAATPNPFASNHDTVYPPGNSEARSAATLDKASRGTPIDTGRHLSFGTSSQTASQQDPGSSLFGKSTKARITRDLLDREMSRSVSVLDSPSPATHTSSRSAGRKEGNGEPSSSVSNIPRLAQAEPSFPQPHEQRRPGSSETRRVSAERCTGPKAQSTDGKNCDDYRREKGAAPNPACDGYIRSNQDSHIFIIHHFDLQSHSSLFRDYIGQHLSQPQIAKQDVLRIDVPDHPSVIAAALHWITQGSFPSNKIVNAVRYDQLASFAERYEMRPLGIAMKTLLDRELLETRPMDVYALAGKMMMVGRESDQDKAEAFSLARKAILGCGKYWMLVVSTERVGIWHRVHEATTLDDFRSETASPVLEALPLVEMMGWIPYKALAYSLEYAASTAGEYVDDRVVDEDNQVLLGNIVSGSGLWESIWRDVKRYLHEHISDDQFSAAARRKRDDEIWTELPTKRTAKQGTKLPVTVDLGEELRRSRFATESLQDQPDGAFVSRGSRSKPVHQARDVLPDPHAAHQTGMQLPGAPAPCGVSRATQIQRHPSDFVPVHRDDLFESPRAPEAEEPEQHRSARYLERDEQPPSRLPGGSAADGAKHMASHLMSKGMKLGKQSAQKTTRQKITQKGVSGSSSPLASARKHLKKAAVIAFAEMNPTQPKESPLVNRSTLAVVAQEASVQSRGESETIYQAGPGGYQPSAYRAASQRGPSRLRERHPDLQHKEFASDEMDRNMQAQDDHGEDAKVHELDQEDASMHGSEHGAPEDMQEEPEEPEISRAGSGNTLDDLRQPSNQVQSSARYQEAPTQANDDDQNEEYSSGEEVPHISCSATQLH